MTTTKFHVDGMTCGGCVASVTRVLEATPGVASSQVDLAGKSALVTYDPALTSVETLVTRITNAGFEARPAG
ncbi:MAG: heavy-metal-associated domain-containing protein [Candidatus Eisenbacteria bacterium]|nr:heavy-metal-associated domain-containing protein [Candidatus Eisenbacteria bacterium]